MEGELGEDGLTALLQVYLGGEVTAMSAEGQEKETKVESTAHDDGERTN